MNTSSVNQPEILSKAKHRFHAIAVGQRIALRPLQRSNVLATSPLTVEVDGGGFAVVFRFGVVVMVDVNADGEASFLATLAELINEPSSERHAETLHVEIDDNAREGFSDEVLRISRNDFPALQLIADVLAKSVMLDEHERRLRDSFDRVEPIAENLRLGQQGIRRAKELTRHIGETLSIQHRMVGRAGVGEKPDLLWDHPDLERLFHRLEEEYDIQDRGQALENKLSLISDTAETMLDLLQTQRTLRVEWYIVILIVVEIVLTVYELFFLHAVTT